MMRRSAIELTFFEDEGEWAWRRYRGCYITSRVRGRPFPRVSWPWDAIDTMDLVFVVVSIVVPVDIQRRKRRESKL